MKWVKVKISSKLLREFRKASKEAYPIEEYAILLGTHDERAGFIIHEFFFPGNRERFTSETGVKIQYEWFREAALYARASNLEVLGDIHSHPSGELGPSECDIDQQTASSFQIFGICGISETKQGLRTRFRFWPSLATIKTKITD